ncbi:MAG: methyltransferase domain-containing protein [Lewinellaceae bacterium]|nr:methyltransferase domain-containing protein [Lewinellaceae bacterium]
MLRENLSLLHVSPEKMLFRKFKTLPGIQYVPADKFDPGYHYPAGTVNMDITDIQYPDAHFDAVICSHVLEHVPDDAKAMKEIHRVLKPGGWAIMLVPIDANLEKTFEDASITDPEARLKAYGQSDHVRQYGMDFGKRLENAGFTVKRDDFVQSFPKPTVFG